MLDIPGMARLAGVPQKELLALSAANEPFALHQPARRGRAEWFAEVWDGFGFGRGTSYPAHSLSAGLDGGAILLPGGETYLNTEKCWKTLVNASRDARYLDLVPAEAFVDRRNPEPITHFSETQHGAVKSDEGGMAYAWLEPDFPELPSLNSYGKQYGPPALVEIWAEKTSMNDALLPLARRYGVNLVTGAGEMSLTSVRLFVDRARRAGVPARNPVHQ